MNSLSIILVSMLSGFLICYMIMSIELKKALDAAKQREDEKSEKDYKDLIRRQNVVTNSSIKSIDSIGLKFDKKPRFSVSYTANNEVYSMRCIISLYDKDKKLVKSYEGDIGKEPLVKTIYKGDYRANDCVYIENIYLDDINIYDEDILYYSFDSNLDDSILNIDSSNYVIKDNKRLYSKFYSYNKNTKNNINRPFYGVTKLNYSENELIITKDKDNIEINKSKEERYIYMVLEGDNTYHIPKYYCELYKDSQIVKIIEGKGARPENKYFNKIIEYKFYTDDIDFEEYSIYTEESAPTPRTYSLDDINPMIIKKSYRYTSRDKYLLTGEKYNNYVVMIANKIYSRGDKKGFVAISITGEFLDVGLSNYTCSIYDKSKKLIKEVTSKCFINNDKDQEGYIWAYFDFEGENFKYFSLKSNHPSYPNIKLTEVRHYEQIDLYNIEPIYRKYDEEYIYFNLPDDTLAYYEFI